MLSVKDAVNASIRYFELIQNSIGDELKNLRLEEAELSDDRRKWLITLGFDVLVEPSRTILELSLSAKYQREYKLFRVDAETGEVEAMKIRVV